jgi:hypothetical protein
MLILIAFDGLVNWRVDRDGNTLDRRLFADKLDEN